MGKGIGGILLIIIGTVMLLTPVVDKIISLDGHTVKQAKDSCDGWLGDLGKTFSKSVREGCGMVDFLYYSSLGLIALGSMLVLVAIIVPKEKRGNVVLKEK